MDKKNTGVILGTVLLIGIAWYAWSFVFNKTLPVQNKKNTSKVVLPSIHTKEYADESGFIFDYPEDLAVSKNATIDASLYADLLISSPKVPGGITVKVADTQFKNTDSWLNKNEKVVAEGLVRDMKLGKMNAKEVVVKNKTITAAVDQKILFTIEMNGDVHKDFWENVYRTIAASFSFSQPEGAGDAASDQSSSENSIDTSGVTFEGEESIE